MNISTWKLKKTGQKEKRVVKYHLEVWLSQPIEFDELQLHYYPNSETPVMELVRLDMGGQEWVLPTNKKVLVNGHLIPKHAQLGRDGYRAAFYVREGVAVEDFKITIYQP